MTTDEIPTPHKHICSLPYTPSTQCRSRIDHAALIAKQRWAFSQFQRYKPTLFCLGQNLYAVTGTGVYHIAGEGADDDALHTFIMHYIRECHYYTKSHQLVWYPDPMKLNGFCYELHVTAGKLAMVSQIRSPSDQCVRGKPLPLLQDWTLSFPEWRDPLSS